MGGKSRLSNRLPDKIKDYFSLKQASFRSRFQIQELQCLVPGGYKSCQLWSSNRWRCYSRFLKWNVDTAKGSHSDSAGGKKSFYYLKTKPKQTKKPLYLKEEELFTHTGCFLSKRALKTTGRIFATASQKSYIIWNKAVATPFILTEAAWAIPPGTSQQEAGYQLQLCQHSLLSSQLESAHCSCSCIPTRMLKI